MVLLDMAGFSNTKEVPRANMMKGTDTTIVSSPASTNRILSAEAFHQLSEMPLEMEWLANALISQVLLGSRVCLAMEQETTLRLKDLQQAVFSPHS